jgi:hypothetical protein
MPKYYQRKPHVDRTLTQVHHSPPPAEVLEERDAALASAPTSPAAILFGDPPATRSALNRRSVPERRRTALDRDAFARILAARAKSANWEGVR